MPFVYEAVFLLLDLLKWFLMDKACQGAWPPGTVSGVWRRLWLLQLGSSATVIKWRVQEFLLKNP